MRFQVPQFIELEDKIFGPFSFKEFTYLAGGAGLSYILYRYIPSFYISLVFIIPVMGFACALAFYRVNNKPFIEVVQSAIVFFWGNRLYIWKKTGKPTAERERNPQALVPTRTKATLMGEGNLTHLSRALDMAPKNVAPADEELISG